MNTPKTIKSRWTSPGHGRARLHLLRKKFANGKRTVLLSFYAAPELAFAVRWDSTLPLDLPDTERFKPYSGVKSFRDVLDQVYEQLEAQFPDPPVSRYRRKQLEIEQRAENEQRDPEDDPVSLWELIISNGSTWCEL